MGFAHLLIVSAVFCILASRLITFIVWLHIAKKAKQYLHHRRSTSLIFKHLSLMPDANKAGKVKEDQFDQLIANTFKVGKKIGEGSYGEYINSYCFSRPLTNLARFLCSSALAVLFISHFAGQVRIGTNIRTDQIVAIKFERNRPESQLPGEYKIYQILQNTKGFPTVYHFGIYLGK